MTSKRCPPRSVDAYSDRLLLMRAYGHIVNGRPYSQLDETERQAARLLDRAIEQLDRDSGSK